MPLTRQYMQARDWRWKYAGGATADGACLALSVQWIIATAQKDDFFAWLGASKIASGAALPHEDADTQDLSLGLAQAGEPVLRIHQLMATQKQIVGAARGSLGDVEKFNFVTQTLLEDAHLKARKKHKARLPADSRHDADLDDWASSLAADPGYKYISIGGYRNVAAQPPFQHGIAAWLPETDHYQLFDPNFGEFSGAKAKLAGDLTAILRHTYQLCIETAEFMTFA